MPAWNLPRAAMNLSALTGVGTALAVGAAVHCTARGRPLLAAALAHTAAAGAAVSLCSSERLHRRCLGLFGKEWSTGRIGWPAYLAMLPYHLAVWAALWLYRLTSREPLFSRVTEGLYLGGWPLSARDLPSPPSEVALLDVTNELSTKVGGAAYKVVPSWETHGAGIEGTQAAVDWALEQRRAGRLVSVYCTHGHGRSAALMAAVLLAAGDARSVDAAMRRIKAARPGASPNRRQMASLEEWARTALLRQG